MPKPRPLRKPDFTHSDELGHGLRLSSAVRYDLAHGKAPGIDSGEADRTSLHQRMRWSDFTRARWMRRSARSRPSASGSIPPM